MRDASLALTSIELRDSRRDIEVWSRVVGATAYINSLSQI
jgi:hypothetical protein